MWSFIRCTKTKDINFGKIKITAESKYKETKLENM